MVAGWQLCGLPCGGIAWSCPTGKVSTAIAAQTALPGVQPIGRQEDRKAGRQREEGKSSPTQNIFAWGSLAGYRCPIIFPFFVVVPFRCMPRSERGRRRGQLVAGWGGCSEGSPMSADIPSLQLDYHTRIIFLVSSDKI